MIKTKFWVLAAFLLLAVSGALTFWMYGGSDAVQARIIVDGEVVRTIKLDVDEPYELDVATEYGTNRVRVEQGRICVTDADCPDKLCVGMGWRSGSGVPIVCLPHHLVIEIEDSADVDAVAGVAP